MKKLLRSDEHCKDCEEVMEDEEFGGGGSPREAYEEGHHLCGKKKPRVYRVTTHKDNKEKT